MDSLNDKKHFTFSLPFFSGDVELGAEPECRVAKDREVAVRPGMSLPVQDLLLLALAP